MASDDRTGAFSPVDLGLAEHGQPRFQILALDGGGVRGIFTAAVLAGLEDDLGRPVLDAFDLVVGTSTGGIIALGLGAGLSAREIVDFYVEHKDRIFPKRFGGGLRRIFRSKYDAQPLEESLREIFGDKPLGESVVPLVVPVYNLGENDVYIFKTPHHERLKRDHKVAMWSVAMATSAAPTYFPAFRLPGEHVRLVDGGVWSNNPAVVGVTEAVSMFGRSLTDLRVLSVGTTSTARTRPSKLDRGGLLQWAPAPGAVDVLLSGQSTGAFTQTQHLVGVERVHRLDPPAPQELSKLDHCDARDLIAKASHYSRIFCPTFERIFGSHAAHKYVPLHGPDAQGAVHAHH